MVKLFSEVIIYPKEFNIPDVDISFVIIVSRHKDKWIFVQHKDRDTRELPGGKKEISESILDGAKRELFEETGAIEYELEHVGYWSLVDSKFEKSFGSIFFAEVLKFGDMPDSEIAKVDLFNTIPKNITYPNVHLLIHDMVIKYLNQR